MKVFTAEYRVIYIFNKFGVWFFITENNDFYYIRNDKIQHIGNDLAGEVRIVEDYGDSFILTHYWDNEYNGEFCIRKNKNDLIIEKNKFKTNYKGKIKTTNPFHAGNSFNNTHIALFSTWDITNTILKQFYNKEIDGFCGLILINKSTSKISQFSMPAAIHLTAFSSDGMTLAVVADKIITIIDLLDD